MCEILKISRAAYYKWKNHTDSENNARNELIAEKVLKIYGEHLDMSYRRIRDTLDKYETGDDEKKGKIYLSVILDLRGKRPVAYEYSDHNDNPLVFNTFDKALATNPGGNASLSF